MKPVLKKTLGIILIVLGIVALVTPFTPGSWLALIGLEIVGFGFLLENRYGRALKNKCKNSFENLKRRFRKNKDTRQK